MIYTFKYSALHCQSRREAVKKINVNRELVDFFRAKQETKVSTVEYNSMFLIP